VSSRYLSPNSTSSHECGFPSPNSQPLSPIGHKNFGTLGDHLRNERLKDQKKDKKSLSGSDNGGFLNRQRSSSEFSRFDNHNESAKENNKPRLIGGSMRFTEKLMLPGKSSSLSKISGILPGRLSVDGSDFYRKNYEAESDSFTDTFDLDSESSKMDSTTTGKSSARSRSACGGSTANSSGGVGGFRY
jgi:hypothetical protein